MSVSILSIGDSVLGGAAALLTAYELWLFSRRPAHAEHLWMGVTSLMAAAYAGLMAVHYNVGAEAALLLSRIEGAVLGVTAFATLAWSLTVAGRATPRALTVLWACALLPVGLTLSPWLITGVHPVTQPLGEGVFWRRNVSPGVTALLLVGLALLGGALVVSTRAPPERRREVRHFQLGIGLWGLTALYSAVSIWLGQQAAFSTTEYGFTALAASVVAHDVKRFMEALAQSEHAAESNASKHRALELLHHDVVSSIGEGVVVLDAAQRVRLWNPVAAQLANVPTDSALGERLWDLLRIAAKDEKTLAAKLAQAARGSTVTTAPITQHDHRGRVQVVWTIAPFGHDGGVIAVLRDVTSEQAARAALIRSEKNSRALIESLPDAIAVLQGDQILYINAALSNLLELSAEDSLSGLRAGRLVHHADRQRLQAIREGGTPAELRLSSRHRSITAEVACVPIEFDGAPAQALIARDVTDRNELTARMMELDRMVAVGTLAAGVGHEINNPLAYLTANLEELELSLGKGPAEPKVLVDEALQGARRIRDIVQAISGFSRAAPERHATSLRDAVQSATTMAGNEIRHRARLSIDHQQDFYVSANEAELGQVLLNLLVNACHAVHEGGPEKNEIRVRTYSENGRAVCEVSDTGSGIPANVLPRIFDPFFTTKPVGQGTGLGLSICRQTVRSLGGDIEVESELGVGTTFRVLLPAVEPTTEPLRLAKRVSAPPTRSLRVMLVDDDEALLRSLARPLRRHFDLTLCVSAEEALERLERGEELDAVVTDLMMPGTSGMELYATVERRFPKVAERMLFTTGGAFTPEATAFCAKVADRILPKPISVAELKERVRALAGVAPEPSETSGARLH
ncbi:MAG: ATP-binding protein [Polyangiaceae bacterium]|nr:ATP-binding protein [Polyangiaceae bacterium]